MLIFFLFHSNGEFFYVLPCSLRHHDSDKSNSLIIADFHWIEKYSLEKQFYSSKKCLLSFWKYSYELSCFLRSTSIRTKIVLSEHSVDDMSQCPVGPILHVIAYASALASNERQVDGRPYSVRRIVPFHSLRRYMNIHIHSNDNFGPKNITTTYKNIQVNINNWVMVGFATILLQNNNS